jgi:hypothetical protein
MKSLALFFQEGGHMTRGFSQESFFFLLEHFQGALVITRLELYHAAIPVQVLQEMDR